VAERLVAMSVAALAVLALVPAALAKDGLLFDRHDARVGDSLTLTTSWMTHPGGVRVYLVPLGASPRWWRTYQADAPAVGPPPRLASARYLGVIVRWHGTGGRLQFRVPAVAAGRYVLGFWCRPCNTHWTSALPNFQPNAYGILRIRR
jgi:hypothetical protein